MLLADNRLKILELKGKWNAPYKSKENILSLQAEIQNIKERTSRRDHNRNESKTRNTLGKYSKEKKTWLKKNIKPKESESKLRT